MSRQFGLVFDVDGIIADSEAVNVRATAMAFADILGIRGVQPEDFENGIGKGAEEYVKAGARSHGIELSEEEVNKWASNFQHSPEQLRNRMEQAKINKVTYEQ